MRAGMGAPPAGGSHRPGGRPIMSLPSLSERPTTKRRLGILNSNGLVLVPPLNDERWFERLLNILFYKEV